MQGRRATLGPRLGVRAGVQERGDDSGILGRAATCRGVQPAPVRALGSAPDRRQSATSVAVAASKYSFEFQSAQFMAAAIGAATTVK